MAVALILICFVGILLNEFIDPTNGTIAKGPGNGNTGFAAVDPCRQDSKSPCESLQFATCFGVKLPYSETSTLLVSPNTTQSALQRDLSRWEGLRYSPKCWTMIQPLLCSVYMPKCHEGIIELPSQETCRSTRSACKIVDHWPEFLKCDDSTKFPQGCKNTEFRELGFNSTKICLDPLIQVDNDFNQYDGFDGCGMKCKDPRYTDDEHEFVYNLIFYVGLIVLVLNGGAVVTFFIEWDKSLESKSIFCANLCFCIATMGWMLQFLPNQKLETVCRKDGTIRREEKGDKENILCAFVFVVIYAGSLSAMQWMVVFAYNLNRICTQAEQARVQLTVARRLILLITVIAAGLCVYFGQIVGSSIMGICFLDDAAGRRIFIVVPLVVLSIGTTGLLTNSAYRLHKLICGNFVSEDGIKEIKWKIFRLLTYSLIWVSLTPLTIWLELYQTTGRPQWEKAIRSSILCRMNLTETTECDVTVKPGLVPPVVSVLLYFFCATLTSSWVWTGASRRIWIRYISRKCKCDDQQNTRNSASSRRNKFIAKAFPRRNRLGNGGSLSAQTHEDPVGLDKLLDPALMGKDCEQQSRLNFRTNTEGTGDVSSSDFATPVPDFVNRRGGLIPPHSSISCQSEDSRRPSCDSAVMADLAAKHFQGSTSTLDGRTKKNRSKSHWLKLMGQPRKGKRWGREYGGSSTSVESNGGNKIFPVVTALIGKKFGRPESPAQIHNQLIPLKKKAVIMKELAIQTSIEKLSIVPSAKNSNVNTPNNNFSMHDKSTQSSLRNLHEIGTQTKKSATKKKDKDREKDCKKKEKLEGNENGINHPETPMKDPVLKLLSPN